MVALGFLNLKKSLDCTDRILQDMPDFWFVKTLRIIGVLGHQAGSLDLDTESKPVDWIFFS